MMTEEDIRKFLANLNEKTTTSVEKVRFPSLNTQPLTALPVKTGIRFLEEVKVDIVAELGETILKTREVLELKEGAVIGLDRAAGDAVDLLINNQKCARGEVLVLNEIFAVRVSAVHSPRTLLPEDVADGK
ncbi:MAG: FliM/FliN family flagellar motor switch protein [Bacillota bacterium]